VTEDDLRAGSTSPALRKVIELEVQRAGQLLGAGRPLVRSLHGWARVAVAGYVGGGRATVSALRRARYDVLGRQVRPSRLATAGQAARLVVGR
jgi:phytoene/squalene synthetase